MEHLGAQQSTATTGARNQKIVEGCLAWQVGTGGQLRMRRVNVEEDDVAKTGRMAKYLEHLGAQQSTATTGATAAPLENRAP